MSGCRIRAGNVLRKECDAMAENVVIRPEKAADFSEIYTLVKEAFATARVSDGMEQDFVTQLRSGRNYIPELALVMEKDGVLIGQVMLTHLAIKSDKAVKALLLAPLCVALPERNRGYGQALIAEALKRAAALGYQAVFLVGDIAYYHKAGFERADRRGINNTDNIPAQYVLVRELVPGVLKNASGTISFYEE